MHRPIDPPHGTRRWADTIDHGQRPSVRMRLALILFASLAFWIGIVGVAELAFG